MYATPTVAPFLPRRHHMHRSALLSCQLSRTARPLHTDSRHTVLAHENAVFDSPACDRHADIEGATCTCRARDTHVRLYGGFVHTPARWTRMQMHVTSSSSFGRRDG